MKQLLDQMLLDGKTVNVIFTKSDGTERKMTCVNSPDIVNENYEYNDVSPVENPNIRHVWDLEKHAWRAFKWDSIKSFSELT